jgi:hypothetical protein
MTMSGNRYSPLFDIHPVTGVSIEIFYVDTMLETFGRGELVGSGGRGGAVSHLKLQRMARSPRATRPTGTLSLLAVLGSNLGTYSGIQKYCLAISDR